MFCLRLAEYMLVAKLYTKLLVFFKCAHLIAVLFYAYAMSLFNVNLWIGVEQQQHGSWLMGQKPQKTGGNHRKLLSHDILKLWAWGGGGGERRSFWPCTRVYNPEWGQKFVGRTSNSRASAVAGRFLHSVSKKGAAGAAPLIWSLNWLCSDLYCRLLMWIFALSVISYSPFRCFCKTLIKSSKVKIKFTHSILIPKGFFFIFKNFYFSFLRPKHKFTVCFT